MDLWLYYGYNECLIKFTFSRILFRSKIYLTFNGGVAWLFETYKYFKLTCCWQPIFIVNKVFNGMSTQALKPCLIGVIFKTSSEDVCIRVTNYNFFTSIRVFLLAKYTDTAQITGDLSPHCIAHVHTHMLGTWCCEGPPCPWMWFGLFRVFNPGYNWVGLLLSIGSYSGLVRPAPCFGLHGNSRSRGPVTLWLPCACCLESSPLVLVP